MEQNNTNESKLNILIVHNYYQIPGGEDVVVANESEMLSNHGHNVILYTRDNKELNSMSSLKKLGLFFTTIFNVRTYKEVCKLIKDNNINIVHVHNTLNLVSPAVYYAAKKCGVPVVQTIHNYRMICPGATLYRYGQICQDCIEKGLGCAIKHRCYRGSFLQTLTCALATGIHRRCGIYRKINYICLTEFGKDTLLKANLKAKKGRMIFDSSRMYVKPNFMKKAEQEIVPASERRNEIVFAGRLDETKGVDILLKAWEMFEKRQMGELAFDNSMKLVICGTGPMEEWCKRFVEEAGLQNVVLVGQVQHEAVIEKLKSAKCMVIPTKWYEGFPMSIAESLSVGTPVIGPDMGNVGAIISDGITGYKFRASDVTELAGVFRWISNGIDEGLYEKAYNDFCEKYTADKNYEMLMEIYNSLK